MSMPPRTAPGLSPILLVDDDKEQLDIYGEVLSPFFEITAVTSTREALRRLQEKVFKAIVCDYAMPGGNGLSFLIAVAEKYPNTQRILVTGYMKPDMLMRKVNEAALYRYLLKPVSLTELVRTVQEAVAHYDQVVATG